MLGLPTMWPGRLGEEGGGGGGGGGGGQHIEDLCTIYLENLMNP